MHHHSQPQLRHRLSLNFAAMQSIESVCWGSKPHRETKDLDDDRLHPHHPRRPHHLHPQHEPRYPPATQPTRSAMTTPTPTPGGRGAKEFRYSPLTRPVDNVHQIRLLCIQPDATPGVGSATSPLSIKLYHSPLERDMHPFSVLSYCEGEGADRDHLVAIRCNGKWLRISRTLYTFLRAVRNRRSTPGEPTYIWVDPICVNHGDAVEKNYQASLMRTICRRAHRSLVWLGDAGPDADLALPVVPLLAAAAREQEAACATTQLAALQREDWRRVGLTMPETELRLRVRALHRLLRRDWFRCAWTVQEYALARSVVFLCGSGDVDAEDLQRATTFTATSQMDAVMGSRWADPALQPLALLRSEMQSSQRVPLLSLLKRYHGFHAADPRDKVFSLLSLASDAGQDLGGLNIAPDYESSTGAIYQLMAMKFIFRDRNLEIVTLAGTYTPLLQQQGGGSARTVPRTHRRLPGLPSWVPDWSLPDMTASIQQHFERGQPPPTREPRSSLAFLHATPPRFRASGLSGHNPNLALIMSGKLPVRCQFLGTVTALGEADSATFPVPDDWVAPKSDAEDADEAFRMLDLLTGWIELVGGEQQQGQEQQESQASQTYFTGESMLDVLWQSMLCGHLTHSVGTERRLFMEWHRATSKMRTLPDHLRLRPQSRKLVVQAYNSYNLASRAQGSPASFMAHAALGIRNRAVFLAGGGSGASTGYVGMAPAGTHVGDAVVILEGASVPMILRQKRRAADEWEVVGACYVHGCMTGKAFDASKCKEVVLV